MIKTLISWTLTLALTGVAIYVYRPDLIHKLVSKSPAQNTRVSSPSGTRPSNKRQKSKKSAGTGAGSKGNNVVADTSSQETQVSKKRKISTQGSNIATTTGQGQEQRLSRKDGEVSNDKEFAQQLAKAQAGTKMQSSSHQTVTESNGKKLAEQNSKPDLSGISTEASSTAGRDADDDLSPIDSSDDHSKSNARRAGDISDMLETPGAKPTTLRLTGISQDSKKPKQASKSFEPVVSKKKRNEQARREEQRLLREESERIHEAKKQEQLRRARMAAGTSNQTKANAFTSSANAWQSGKTEVVKSSPAASSSVTLLDTFEPPTSISHPKGAVHTEPLSNVTNKDINGGTANALREKVGQGVTSALGSSSREQVSRPLPVSQSSWADEMSEEDQMKILQAQQDDDAWESVTNKKSKKKGKQDNDTGSEASSSVQKAVNTTSKPHVNGNTTNTIPKETANRFQSIQAAAGDGLRDDEWHA